jgi:hypothetical protein
MSFCKFKGVAGDATKVEKEKRSFVAHRDSALTKFGAQNLDMILSINHREGAQVYTRF